MKREVTLIGAPTDIGAGSRGASMHGKNLAIMGGMLYVVVNGPGRLLGPEVTTR